MSRTLKFIFFISISAVFISALFFIAQKIILSENKGGRGTNNSNKEAEESLARENYEENPYTENVIAGAPLQSQEAEKTAIKAARFLFFGDLMLDRHIKERYGKNYAALLEKLKTAEGDLFYAADLTCANLEGAVTNGGAHYAPVYAYDFAFTPESVKIFQDNNFNFFNIANNHLTDQGAQGVAETAENLASLGLMHSGCPDGTLNECALKIATVNNLKTGMVGLSMVYKTIAREEIKNILASAQAESEFVVVNIHWGKEYGHLADKVQIEMAHFLIDSGADLVIGHHPHVIQGIEKYQNKLIFYSLGNFIFDQYFSADTQTHLSLGIEYEEGDLRAQLFPLKSQLGIPEPASGSEKEKILQDIAAWSQGEPKFLQEITAGEIAVNIF